MALGKVTILLGALLGSFGVASAAAPHCGVFGEDSGTVNIVSEGTQFSIGQLMNSGRFSAVGPQFGCWTEIGTSPEIRGTMMYSYRITDPKGASNEFGPYGIQAGGFGSGSIAAYTSPGTWRVEFLLVSRDNGSKSSIGSITFAMNP